MAFPAAHQSCSLNHSVGHDPYWTSDCVDPARSSEQWADSIDEQERREAARTAKFCSTCIEGDRPTCEEAGDRFFPDLRIWLLSTPGDGLKRKQRTLHVERGGASNRELAKSIKLICVMN